MNITEFTTADNIEEIDNDYLQLQLYQIEQLKQQQRAGLYQKLQQARKDFKDKGITKTGVNKFQKYKYIKLDDIVDIAIDVLYDNKLSTKTGFGKKPYYVELIDTETGYGEKFESDVDDWKYEEIEKDSTHNKILQTVGKKESYLRRYIYMQIFDIHDKDQVEIEAEKHAISNKPVQYPNRYQKQQPQMRNIQDLARDLADEMTSQGTEYNVANMWDFINEKWKKQLINKEEFKALKKHLGINK